VEAAEPIVKEIARRRSNLPLVLTTMTRTGKSRAQKIAGAATSFVPIDLPGPVRKSVASIRPALLLLVETELWPNLIREADHSGCSVVLASGRISRRAMGRMRWASPLYRKTLRRFSLIGVQREIDRERFLRFGAPGERVFIHGSTKVDAETPEAAPPDLRRSEKERWVVFGSVRSGEERAVLAAVRSLLASDRRNRVAVAPRHPERAADYLRDEEIPWRLWSESRPADSPAILVDTVGDLLSFYALADVAFVGGSFSRHGGHNPLEPARFGVPVLMGPWRENCRELSDLLEEAGALEVVSKEEELGERIRHLLEDRSESERRGAAGREAIRAHRGAARRLVDRLEAEGLLPMEEG
jgi:3-deoxy-D-manno-octulosonic-acid transferase